MGFKSAKGTVLTDFVKAYPEKSSYFELSDKNEKWVFPVPGALEGVKSRGRTILQMTGVTFKYPTSEKNIVENISLSVCMASRVAVVGANGAGKSTAIKLLIGELKPEQGSIWRHQNMRLAYVAQHAFHHLEKHMDKTAVDYIMWRFQGADDKESLENMNMEVTDDDEKKRERPWFICPKSLEGKKCDMTDTPEGKKERAAAVVPEALLNRQKHTKTKKYIYEVKWMHKSVESNSWVEREVLLEMGYSKLVGKKDEQEAAAAGLLSQPLASGIFVSWSASQSCHLCQLLAESTYHHLGRANQLLGPRWSGCACAWIGCISGRRCHHQSQHGVHRQRVP